MINKITEADLINKGVVGLPDVPGLTTIEMQNKFEEISRDVIIPRFNELIDNTVSASDEFSKLSTYNVGDYCIYQSVLYKCTTEINTAGEWDSAKWKATSIDKELKEISSSAENKDVISDKYDSSKTYAVGDYCIYNDTLYKCKTAVTSAEEFNSSKWEATNCGKELVALNSNLIVPDYKSAVAIQSDYTCMTNGYVIGTIQGEINGWANIRSSKNTNYFLALGTSSEKPTSVCIPFAAGDTVIFGTQGTYNLAFAPAK